MTDSKKIGTWLGFATKSAQVVFGQFAVERALEKRKISLVLLDEDLSLNSKDRFLGLCEKSNTKYFFLKNGLIKGATGTKGDMVVGLYNCKLAQEIENHITKINNATINGGTCVDE